MECLRDYIGVKHCDFAPSDSGMYINSLAGIEFAIIDKIANADQTSWSQVWDDVQERAIERFRLDVLGKYSGFDRRYKLRQITQSVDLGIDLTSGTQQVPSAKQRGLVIEFINPGDQVICSNMQSLYVQSVQFYCVNAGVYVLVIRDADYGTTLATYNVTGVQGWNTSKVDTQFDGMRRVSITIDATAITTAYLDLSQFNLQGFAQGNWAGNCGWYNNGLWFNYGCTGTAQVRGYEASATYTNPVYGVNTFGISAIFSVRCTYNNIVCNNKKYFATAFRLVLGIELMTEVIFTSRLNRWSTVDKQKAKDLRREFEAQYRGGVLTSASGKEEATYEGELDRACYSIDLDLSDCCLQTDAMIMWRESQM